MTKQLSANPNLEQIKKQAKDLKKAHHSREPEAIGRFMASHPEYAKASETEIAEAEINLSDAQWAIAREYGFESWAKLKRYIEAHESNMPEFIAAVDEGDAAKVGELLKSSAFLRERIDASVFSFDAPAIVQAASRNHQDLIDILLEYGANIDAKSGWWAGGWSALHHATAPMFGHHPNLADFLIDRGATIDTLSAAGLGRLDRLKERVEAKPDAVHERGGDGMTPLHFAATPEIAAFLLEHSADINARDRDHLGTPVQWAVGGSSEPREVCQYLVEQGAEVDILLLCAIGDMARVKALLVSNPECANQRFREKAPGGHVYAYTRIGMPAHPIRVAISYDRFDMLLVLLEAGGELQLTDWMEMYWKGPKRMAEYVQFLVEHGVDLNAKQPHRRGLWTPLHWLTQSGYTRAVGVMLSHGADPNVPDNEGRTPLHIISGRGVGKPIVKLLLEHGADINAQDSESRTPLDYAKNAKKDAVARMLVELGAVSGA